MATVRSIPEILEKSMEVNPPKQSKRKLRSADEAGFTMIEMVVAIPIVFLILGLVFSSVGVTVALMGQVTAGAGAARVASGAMDELSSARSCAEVSSIVQRSSLDSPDSKFLLSFAPYSCSPNLPLSLDLEVREDGKDTVYYSKTLTLAVM